MNCLVESNARRLFSALCAVLLGFFALLEGLVACTAPRLALPVGGLSVLLAAGILGSCLWYLHRQEQLLQDASDKIRACLDGDAGARIDCNQEGALYRLFHMVNTLAAVLSAHADNGQREREFLKHTISDISHQLKTPLAALNIYNGLLQAEPSPEEVQQFAALSEQELDRMETLVQNLLKITRLDAGSIVFEQEDVPLADLLREVQHQFAFRAQQEEKEITLTGEESVLLHCDRTWMREALGNLVKNALDHTAPGDHIRIQWTQAASLLQIKVQDNGSGIHPEDLPHIFKRFYRSRFSQQTPGIGLGLPLAKAIVDAHGGTIEVDSTLHRGTSFTLNFRIPTKL